MNSIETVSPGSVEGPGVARVGHFDTRRQADIRCALRSGTPKWVWATRASAATVCCETWVADHTLRSAGSYQVL